MRRSPALLAGVLLAAAVGVGSIPAARADGGAGAAQPPLEQLVILLRPASIDELTREALSRITGELTAARFRVIIFPLDESTSSIEQVETVGRDLDPVAAFALVRGTGASAESVELWISDRRAQRTTIQRMRLRPVSPAASGDVSRAAAVLAVESVELLRVNVAGTWPRPPVQARGPSHPPAVERPGRALSVALGAGLLHDFHAARPSLAPTLGIGFGRPDGLAVSLVARGLGPDTQLVQSVGSARVQQAAAWVALSRTFRAGRVLQPFLSLGVGADWLRATGSAADPTLAHARTSWSGVAMAGGGLAVAVATRLALVLDVEGMLFVPPVVVRIAGADAARFDRPSVLVDAAIRASF